MRIQGSALVSPVAPQTSWLIADTSRQVVAAAAAAPADSVSLAALAVSEPPQTEGPLWSAFPAKGDFSAIMGYFRASAEGLPGFPAAGYAARLALAVGGEVDFPQAPYDSMLERSFADSRPDEYLRPALETAAHAPLPVSFESLVDLAEKMVDALPMDWNRPMEKAYAAIRLQVGLAKCLGETKVVSAARDDGSDGFLIARLSNLKRDAQSVTLATVTVGAVRDEFQRIREVARTFDRKGGIDAANGRDQAPTSAIQVNHEEGYVNIGGVRVGIRR